MHARAAAVTLVFAVLAQAGALQPPAPGGAGAGEDEALPPGLHDGLMSGGVTPKAPHAPAADPFADRHGHPHLQYCNKEQCADFCQRAEMVADPDVLSRNVSECRRICMRDC